MLEKCVEIVDRRVSNMRSDEILLQLTAADFEAIELDASELKEFFIAGGDGLDAQIAENVTKKLGKGLDELKADAATAKETGKVSKAPVRHRLPAH